MTRTSAATDADAARAAVAAPSASTRHHSSSIFPSLPPSATSALASSHADACCVHSNCSGAWQSQPVQQSAARSRADHDEEEAEEEEEDGGADPYGTRIPLSRLVDLVFASPAELSERAELEMEMLHQIHASPSSLARLYSEAATIPALMQKNRYTNIIPSQTLLHATRGEWGSARDAE